MELSPKEKKYLFSIARKAIEHYFSEESDYYPVDVAEKFMERMGVFVTLYKNNELRGCIGYPLPIAPLAQAIADNAINAAFHDPRFPSIEKSELKDIEIEITILTVPQKIDFKNPKELLEKIKIGRDGLILEYGPYNGLLLPQVPVEEKWDKSTYLSHLCLKAGLAQDAWLRNPIKISSFQGMILREEK